MTDAAVSRSREEPVILFSLHADNKVGRLHEVVALLRSRGIHILALTTVDTTDSAIVRLVVNYPEDARQVFEQSGMHVSESALVVAEIASEESLCKVTHALLQAEINIHYVFSFLARPQGKSAIGLRLEDNDLAKETLQRHGIRVLGPEDIGR